MFRMYVQKTAPPVENKPAYTPPVPNVRVRPLASSVVLGSVFAPIYTADPCMSCGNSK